MGFGKPGRPREDRLARQQQIFGAVRDLLAPGRTRALTMAQAARQANSVGGLYHYFPSKRDLVLFGIDEHAALADQARAVRSQQYRSAGVGAGRRHS
jgi:AcrR family transcriptional regulator